ncbi:hypothetical protein [Arthrobacter sp. USHLN218]|uniref:hypothetical protein n=1 Tax=Arthrobacter sp. USHLN218 TaxID=3081232 RepID=UPI0030171E4E
MRRFVGAVVLVAAGLGLAGCGSGSPIAALDKEPAARDALAADLDGIDGPSARFAAELDSHALFLAKPSDPAAADGVCVVAQPAQDPAGAVAACSQSVPVYTPLVLETGGMKIGVVADGFKASSYLAQGWQQIHRNLLVQTAAASKLGP